MSFNEASRKAEILRNAIIAIETAETLRNELRPAERAELRAAKTALEYALLRVAIRALQDEIEARERRPLEGWE